MDSGLLQPALQGHRNLYIFRCHNATRLDPKKNAVDIRCSSPDMVSPPRRPDLFWGPAPYPMGTGGSFSGG
jgi:hypothetical protein